MDSEYHPTIPLLFNNWLSFHKSLSDFLNFRKQALSHSNASPIMQGLRQSQEKQCGSHRFSTQLQTRCYSERQGLELSRGFQTLSRLIYTHQSNSRRLMNWFACVHQITKLLEELSQSRYPTCQDSQLNSVSLRSSAMGEEHTSQHFCPLSQQCIVTTALGYSTRFSLRHQQRWSAALSFLKKSFYSCPCITFILYTTSHTIKQQWEDVQRRWTMSLVIIKWWTLFGVHTYTHTQYNPLSGSYQSEATEKGWFSIST